MKYRQRILKITSTIQYNIDNKVKIYLKNKVESGPKKAPKLKWNIDQVTENCLLFTYDSTLKPSSKIQYNIAKRVKN